MSCVLQAAETTDYMFVLLKINAFSDYLWFWVVRPNLAMTWKSKVHCTKQEQFLSYKISVLWIFKCFIKTHGFSWRVLSCGMWSHLGRYFTDVSDKHAASIFRVKDYKSKQQAWSKQHCCLPVVCLANSFLGYDVMYSCR